MGIVEVGGKQSQALSSERCESSSEGRCAMFCVACGTTWCSISEPENGLGCKGPS